MFINDLFNKKQLNESLQPGEYVTFEVFFDDGSSETLNFDSDDINWERVGARRNKKVVNAKRIGGIRSDTSAAPKQSHQYPDDSFARAQRAYDRQLPEAYDTSPDNREYFDTVQEWAQTVLEMGGEVIKARGVYVAHGWDGEMGEFDPSTGEGWLVSKTYKEGVAEASFTAAASMHAATRKRDPQRQDPKHDLRVGDDVVTKKGGKPGKVVFVDGEKIHVKGTNSYYPDHVTHHTASELKKGVAEGSVQDKLHRRHQELRKKSGLPDPDYYKELRSTYDLPDQERFAKQAELKKKYKVTNEDVEKYVEELERAGYDIITEQRMTCPECGGAAYEDRMLAEKQDACYHKVKSRYKVWPSAYASGALVRCRKVGAKNWGKKSKK